MSSSPASSSSGPGRRHRLRGAAAARTKPRAKASKAKGKAKKAKAQAPPWSLPVPKRPRTSGIGWKWGSTRSRTRSRTRSLQELPPQPQDDRCLDQPLRPGAVVVPLGQVYARTTLMEHPHPHHHKPKLPCKRKSLKDNAAVAPALGGGEEGGSWSTPPSSGLSWCSCLPRQQQQQQQQDFREFQWTADSPPPSSPFQLETSIPRKRKLTKSSIISGRHEDAQRQQQLQAVSPQEQAVSEQRPQEQQQRLLLEEQQLERVFLLEPHLQPPLLEQQQQQPGTLEPPTFFGEDQQQQQFHHPNPSDNFVSLLHQMDATSWNLCLHQQAYFPAYPTVNVALGLYANAPARQPVRRSLNFDEHNSPMSSLAGLADQGSALRGPLSPVTPQMHFHPSRTLSPSLTPPSCLSLGYAGCHSELPPTTLSTINGNVTLPHPQQQGDLFQPVQAEGVHLQHKSSNPDAAPFDLNSVPTPERKPPRRKYTPKVVKEPKVRVTKIPKPAGDQVHRRPGRPRKQQHQGQEQALARQDRFDQCISTDGLGGDQSVGYIVDFVKNGKPARKTKVKGATKQQAKPLRMKSKANEVKQQPHSEDCICQLCWENAVSQAQAHSSSDQYRRIWPKELPPSPAKSERTVEYHVGGNGLQQRLHLHVTPMAVREASLQSTFSTTDFSIMQQTPTAGQGLAAYSTNEDTAQAEPLCIGQRGIEHVPLQLPPQEPEPMGLIEASGCTDDNRLALVPHNGATDMIIYQDPLLKKKKPRAKVVLDEATLRCWNLLMGNRQPEIIDQDGIQSRKWEQEREAMKRRVDRFLDRTHQVQGDHTFSLWKGSIVDSVVGAFLTQNVSDQLSSSAFMALAARYPVGGLNKAEDIDEDKAMVYDKDEDQNKLQDQTEYRRKPLHLEQQAPSERIAFKDIISVEAETKGCGCHQAQISDNLQGHAVPGEASEAFEVSQRMSEDRNKNLESQTVMELCATSSAESITNLLASNIEDNRTCGSSKSSSAGSDGEEGRNCTSHQMVSECASSEPSQLQADGAEVSYILIDTVNEAGTPNFILPIDLNHCSFDSQGFSSTVEEIPATVSPSQLEAESSTASLGHFALCRSGHGHGDGAHGENNYSRTNCEANMSWCSVSGQANAVHCEVATLATNFPEQNEEMLHICNYADVHPLPIASISPSLSAIQGSVVEGGPALLQDVNNKRKPRKGYSHLSGLERAHMEAQQGGLSKSRIEWELMRAKVVAEAEKRAEKGPLMDAVDWDSVRLAKLDDIAGVIKERGMNYMLAGRISAFLDRIHTEHGSIDLEWLRDIPAESAKEFLLSIRGLGLKSVECIRLLTLHHLAFPVDTNVGRICVRLGWVPLEPLPEELQLHLLELYPVQATIQQYLWPRLCTLDQHTLYELHYQMITFGKVFCTKSKPNCQACPMSSDCRHYASSSSANLLLKGPEGDLPANKMTSLEWPGVARSYAESQSFPKLALEEPLEGTWIPQTCNPIIEEPSTPEPSTPEPLDPPDTYCSDIEDMIHWSGAVHLNTSASQVHANVQHESTYGEVVAHVQHLVFHSQNSYPQSLSPSRGNDYYSVVKADIVDEGICTSIFSRVHARDMAEDISNRFHLSSTAMSNSMGEQIDQLPSQKALVSSASRELVVIPPEIAARPPTQLKRYGRLRTVHNVYEVPDNHPVLREVEPRDELDPYVYLLAIWGPGEGLQSTAAPTVSTNDECADRDTETVKGTLLIPCRTALRGTFPLNGTYFQKNEVFADHSSSLEPLTVSRALLWNLRRRLVYFGTTATNIYRNLTMEEIQACGWAACVCVRGFERSTRAPRPLVGRLHFPASKLQAQKRATKKNLGSALKPHESESTTASLVG